MSQHGDNESKPQFESIESLDPAQDSMPQADTAVIVKPKEMEAIQSVSDDEGDVKSVGSPQGSSFSSDGDKDDGEEEEEEEEEGEASDNDAYDHDRDSASTENADDTQGNEVHVTEDSPEVKQLHIDPVLSTMTYPALQLREQPPEEQSSRPKIEKLDRPGTKRIITPPIPKVEKFFVKPNIQYSKSSRSTSGRVTWKELESGERVRVIHAPVAAASPSPAPAPAPAPPKINKVDEHEKNSRVAPAAVPSPAVPAIDKKQKKAKAVPVPIARIEASSAIHKKQKKDKAISVAIPPLEAPPAAALPSRRRKARTSGGSDSKKVKEILEREKRRRDAEADTERSLDHIEKDVSGVGSFPPMIEAIQGSFTKVVDGTWEKLFAKGDERGRHRGLWYQYNWTQIVLAALALFVIVSQVIILLG